jgi:ABC-2 type transport system ATP-binding protein
MDHGRVIAQGTPRSLVDGLGDVQFLEFELASELDEARVAALAGVESVERRAPRYRVRLARTLSVLRTVLAELEQQQVVPIGLSSHQATLDDVFLQLTGRGLHEDNGNGSAERLPKASSR